MSQTSTLSHSETIRGERELGQFLHANGIYNRHEFDDFVMHYNIDSADDFAEVLMHYGVKGMKWGLRRSDENLAKRKTFKEKNLGEKVLSIGTKTILGEMISEVRTQGARKRVAEGRGKRGGASQVGILGSDDLGEKELLQVAASFILRGPHLMIVDHINARVPAGRAGQGSSWLEGQSNQYAKTRLEQRRDK